MPTPNNSYGTGAGLLLSIQNQIFTRKVTIERQENIKNNNKKRLL